MDKFGYPTNQDLWTNLVILHKEQCNICTYENLKVWNQNQKITQEKRQIFEMRSLHGKENETLIHKFN